MSAKPPTNLFLPVSAGLMADAPGMVEAIVLQEQRKADPSAVWVLDKKEFRRRDHRGRFISPQWWLHYSTLGVGR